MALPINEVPKYTTKLPSTGENITYRPFLVKEQKVMLTAIESENDDEIASAVNETLQSCLLNTKIDVRELPIFDFEYLFLKIRAKSVGEVVKLRFRCPDDEKQIVDYELNLEDVKIDRPEGHTNKIEFEKGYGVIMRYPTIEAFKKYDKMAELSYKIVKESIATIYKGDDVYDRNNISDEEIEEFVDNLTQKQFEQLQTFYDTMPRIRHKVTYTNPKSGKEFSTVLTGTADFF